MMYGNDGFCPWCGQYIGGSFGVGELLLLGFFGLLVIVGMVLVIVWVVRAAGGGHPSGAADAPPASGEAMRIARERLARGEITVQQYDELIRTLGS
jgi:uncharacterized membrane protein